MDHKENKLDSEWIALVKIIQANPPTYIIKFLDSRESKIHGNISKLYHSILG